MRRRRDPRAEWQARRVPGTERPRFALAAIAPGEGRNRRDPRARRDAARVFVGQRPRIDWKAVSVGGARSPADIVDRAAATVGEPVARVIAEPAFLVLAVLDHPGGILSAHDRQIIAASRDLAGGDGAVVALTSCAIGGLAEAGTDRVIALSEDDADHPEARVARVLAAVQVLKPRHVLFAESAEGGGDIARQVAAKLGERLLAGVETISDGRATRRMGGAMEMRAAVTRLMSIADGAFAPHGGVRHEAHVLDAPAVVPVAPRLRISPLQVDPDRIPIAEADFLLSAGNGVTDWASFAELGAVLGATRAGSRVVCDEGHLPRDRQVGASGTVVTARCYLAFGIAGAPQHLQGITEVGHVVAINTDLHAEMIKRADLAIVADAQEVMPALIRHAKARGAGGPGAGGEGLAAERWPARARKRQDLQIAVLLSVGRHPASGRPRRAPLDARALDLALELAANLGGYAHAVHVGNPGDPALRDYLGMGLKRLTVLAPPDPSKGRDIVPALVSYLRTLEPDLVLSGGRGEGGEESGMVPYLVAEALGMPMVAEAAGIETEDGSAQLIQSLPRGRRRLVNVRLPVVAAIGAAAPPARQVAFARSRRGIIDAIRVDATDDGFLAAAEIRPWRPRPKRLAIAQGASAADRLRAMTETKAGAGAILIRPEPEVAARAIYDFLLANGIVVEGLQDRSQPPRSILEVDTCLIP